MGSYDNRDSSTYGDILYYAPYTNRNISKWWTTAHDKLIEDLIHKYQWGWYWKIADAIIETLPKEIAEPLSRQYAWYNKVMYFAITRAKELGLVKNIRKAEVKTCPLCNQKFTEDSLPGPLVARLGLDQLNFCAPCLSDALFDSANPYASRENVLDYLRNMANVLNRVPTQDFGGGVNDLHGLDGQERLRLLQLLKRKPELSRVKELFGSWLNALKEAGILEDGARRTSRGTQCLAKDGHVCLSLGEKTIDDVLYAHGIPHQKEGRYPDENLRADFVVDDVFIEYLGLAGDSDYDAKTKRKQDISSKCNINLILLYPKDLVSSKKLVSKLSAVLSKQTIRVTEETLAESNYGPLSRMKVGTGSGLELPPQAAAASFGEQEGQHGDLNGATNALEVRIKEVTAARKARRGKSGYYMGRLYYTYVDEAKSLVRNGKLEEAETLLIGLIEATESESHRENSGVGSWYYEELANVYRRSRNLERELAILERYARYSAGYIRPELLKRLEKVRAYYRSRKS